MDSHQAQHAEVTTDLLAKGGCPCPDCQPDLRLSAALEHVERYYDLRLKAAAAMHGRLRLATSIRFPAVV